MLPAVTGRAVTEPSLHWAFASSHPVSYCRNFHRCANLAVWAVLGKRELKRLLRYVFTLFQEFFSSLDSPTPFRNRLTVGLMGESDFTALPLETHGAVGPRCRQRGRRDGSDSLFPCPTHTVPRAPCHGHPRLRTARRDPEDGPVVRTASGRNLGHDPK